MSYFVMATIWVFGSAILLGLLASHIDVAILLLLIPKFFLDNWVLNKARKLDKEADDGRNS